MWPPGYLGSAVEHIIRTGDDNPVGVTAHEDRPSSHSVVPVQDGDAEGPEPV